MQRNEKCRKENTGARRRTEMSMIPLVSGPTRRENSLGGSFLPFVAGFVARIHGPSQRVVSASTIGSDGNYCAFADLFRTKQDL